MSKTENNILLFSITLCWAASYVFIKDLPSELSTFGYLTMTCGISAVLLTMIFWKKLKSTNLVVIGKSAVLAVLLALNLILDKHGIDGLPSSTASVMASCTILIVPLILIMMHKPITKNKIVGAIIILFGILITNGFAKENLLSIGSLFMFLSAVVCSIYTIAVDKITKEEDPLLLTIFQLWMCAILGFVLWFIEEPATFATVTYSKSMLSSIFILAFFSKAYAYLALMYSQRYSDPISVTVIASTEPVVTLFLAVLIPTAFTEHLTVMSVLGSVVIMIGAMVSGLRFHDRKKVESR